MNTLTEKNPDRRERKKTELRLKIIAETMQAFKKSGFHSITMEQIAELSDISKATLYKYFPVKEAILAAYWQEEMINSHDEFTLVIDHHADTANRLIALLNCFMRRIMENRALYEIYISYRLQNLNDIEGNKKLRSGAEQYVLQIITAGQELGDIRADTATQLLTSNFELLSIMQAMMWLRQPQEFCLETSSVMIVDLFLKGAGIHV
ncbi:MAG: TetR/AcrR family transcriptional regulator [Thiohalomonadales bacterium]